jgi:hypothetical protein
MKIFLISMLLIGFTLGAFAQNEELITDRPDQTESAQVVPVKTIQIESGFVLEKDHFLNSTNTTFNSTLLRLGLVKNFELRLGYEYLKGTSDISVWDTKGFSPLYVGMKYQITVEDGLFPGIAFLGGLSLPFFASDDYQSDKLAPDFRFAVSHTLTEWLSLGYNLGIEWNGDNNDPMGIYSIAFGFGLTDNLGCYLEAFGSQSDIEGAQHMVDGGFTYLLRNNFQLDISGGLGLNDNAADYYIAGGFSWRIPH